VNNATQINRHQKVREEVKRSNLSLRRIPGVMILEVKKKMQKKIIDTHYTAYCNYC
jgi:argonaute-like protein implicated in RNA metabolism and viral defense